ncbi:MAG: hypothetical protein AB1349_02920 [Elusimicrobiota bacterium]
MRIIKQIEIEQKPAIALFDTGATASYIREELLFDVPKRIIGNPYKVGLGGKPIEVKQICVAIGKMEKWEIKLDPKTGQLDLEGLRRREFTEF